MRERQRAVSRRPADRQRARRSGVEDRVDTAAARHRRERVRDVRARIQGGRAINPLRARLSPFAAGILALGLIALACYFAFGGSLPWSSEYEVYAQVRSANELHSRTPVRIAGVEVGRVAGFKRGPGDTAVIKLALSDRARPIHRDATLKIRPRIFLEGNFFVDLKPG